MNIPEATLTNYLISSGNSQQTHYRGVMEMSQAEVDHINREEEEELEKIEENTIYKKISDNPETFYQFTGFSIQNFEILFGLVEEAISQTQRGRKPRFTPLDQFLLFLHYLRTYPRMEAMKAVFNLEPSTFKSLISKNLSLIAPILEGEFIRKRIFESLDIDSPEDFPECKFIVDATVQKINKPYTEFDEASKFFSGKHYIYCLKSQVIINLKGLAVDIVTSIPGSHHDKSIFDNNIEIFLRNFSESFTILADKGYQDRASKILLTPVKGNYRQLTPDQLRKNEKISKIRILIENYFGRLKAKFSIMEQQYRGSHAQYKDIFTTCCALVNFDIMFGNPLREEDYKYFSRFRAIVRREVMEEKKNISKKAKSKTKKNIKI